ncbi:hypothetical protein F11_02635 [Rhodospirillum rubrum F11]|nr:hypothetical protein F11_02635 [Rhodospirillum rubrum F11]
MPGLRDFAALIPSLSITAFVLAEAPYRGVIERGRRLFHAPAPGLPELRHG